MLTIRCTHMKKFPIEVGAVYGDLTVIGEAESSSRKFKVLCKCGTVFDCLKGSVRGGNTKSCGCARVQTLRAMLTKHGLSKRGAVHPLYRTWADMRKRVLSDKSTAYIDYGGRGIKICSRWDDFSLFVSDMGPKPGPDWTVDRIDVNGDYEPSNCRWATQSTQANNTRSSLRYVYNGVAYTAPEIYAIAETFGVRYGTLHARLAKGVPVKEAVETPSARSKVRQKFSKDRVSRPGIVSAYPVAEDRNL